MNAGNQEIRSNFLRHKNRILLIGPSASGKSHFIYNLLKNPQLFGVEFESIHLFSTTPSSSYLSWAAHSDKLIIEDR